MDEDNTFEELIDSIEPTSSGSISQNALEPGMLIVTDHSPKQVKRTLSGMNLLKLVINDIATKNTKQKNVFESKKIV